MKSSGRTTYALLSVLVIIAFYLIPYTYLRSSKDLTLTAFWTSLTLLWIITSNYVVRRWVK